MSRNWRQYVGVALLAVAVIGIPVVFVYKVLPLILYAALAAVAVVGAAYLVLGKQRFKALVGGITRPTDSDRP